MGKWFQIPPGDPYYCVVGSPIDHSKSPEIHLAFGKQCGIALRYEKVEIEANRFGEALADFVAAGGRGMSITVPLKEEACLVVPERGIRAAQTGAANMLSVDASGATHVDNVDGTGLVQDLLVNQAVEIRDRRVLLLGAGGAARGVIPSLLEHVPAQLSIANRTLSRAMDLVERFGDLGTVSAHDYANLPLAPYDLVINATSMSLTGDIPPLPPSAIDSGTTCYDMMYTADGRTPFLDWCRAQNARTCRDGWGMLVEQAATAFAIWHGIKPDTARVIAELR